MEKQEKPRLAEVLGVEVGERFTMRDGNIELPGLYVEKDGTMYERDGICASGSIYSFLINHPESIIRAPRLTEAELAICRAVGAKWVSRNQIGANSLHLWDKKPGGNKNFWNGDAMSLATVAENLFPSVQPGDLVEVPE